jgi:murein DD-endopeptidase MepM/ murein hydrolase activator NlpD
MSVILFTRSRHKAGPVRLSLAWLAVAAVLLVSMVSGGVGWAGYQLGLQDAAPVADRETVALRSMLEEQRREVQDTQARTREHLDALALRLGQMQSHILRLDALGERLTEIGNLDNGEFNFSEVPAQGGLDASGTAESIELTDLLADLDALTLTIDDREQKLNLLEDLLMNRKLGREIHPSGRPVKSGWVSSYFGYRKDPFTGKKAFHQGVDVAGKEGSDVIAVASGVVTWASERFGYGHLVEINHGNGYVTRYGHNSKLLVKQGDTVAKGEVIAQMGSSGRSTGPHVHFEVLRNGKAVNPSNYLRASN